MAIEMSDLPMVPKISPWRMKLGLRNSINTDLNMFRVKLKAAMLNYELKCQTFGKEHKNARKALRNYNFYFNQIDQDQSDTFTLLMYTTDEWHV